MSHLDATLAPETSPASLPRRRAHLAPPERVDVAIVGAGLGGLVSAATLARAGLRVACFESHYAAGGCATQFARGPKSARYHFDVGLHYIGDCGPRGVIPSILRGLGVELDYASLDPDGFDTLVFPDLTFRVPADVDRYRDRLADLFPHEKKGIDGYVKLLGAVMHAGARLDRSDGRLSARALLGILPDALSLYRIDGRTIGQVLRNLVRDPRLVAVLLGQSGDYGLPPSQVSAALHLGLSGHYFRGAFYPKGGGQVIADRVALACEGAGGSIHLRRGVSRVLIEGGRAVGVVLRERAGEPEREVRARAVISNADLRRTLLELVGPQHLPASWISRARGFQMPAALFMTFLGVRGDMRARGMRAANYWQFDGYDMEGFYRDADALRPRGCYITSASLKDPDNALHHAPAGVTNVEVMTVVGGTGQVWGVTDADADAWRYGDEGRYAEVKRAIEEDMIARLERLFPGSAEGVVYRESATPITHRRFTGATGGTGYGLAATVGQFMKARPGYRGPIPGLYFAGASTRAGHGIVGAMMSGRRAAQRVAADLGVHVEAHQG